METQNGRIVISEIHDKALLKHVEELAWKIFPETYKTILTKEQIPYMMHMMYDSSVLEEEFARHMHFALILNGDLPVGYISWHLLEQDSEKNVKLEKLYLDFSMHGRSIGNMALKFVIREAEKEGCSAVLLNVNKENLRAQKAYARAGFSIWKSEKNPIGNGFFMDDYVMKHPITHS